MHGGKGLPPATTGPDGLCGLGGLCVVNLLGARTPEPGILPPAARWIYNNAKTAKRAKGNLSQI